MAYHYSQCNAAISCYILYLLFLHLYVCNFQEILYIVGNTLYNSINCNCYNNYDISIITCAEKQE